ncbi:MAG: glycosyltransferase family 2 protein [Candidatus Omnitrophica bacterium]|jgi:abequosyltransferase|nr:glycosyltransferase family 2 protein [Candidatus Omnitrophota bacterium]
MENSSAQIKLSFCIPTYNRAGFIGQTLDSIISQASDNIEIVIVDGASTDNTSEVVDMYRKKFKNLVYFCSGKNMGVDRDMAKTIELARGQYCWMFSDDDLLKPRAIKTILKEIESGCEIYLCNITACNLNMHAYKQMSWLSVKIEDRIFNLDNAEEFKFYCNNANSIGALFSYMSSIILRREQWNISGFDQDFQSTAYALASSLISFTARKCRLKYIKDSLVLWRNDNESFQYSGGLVKRFLLDFDGYLKLADKYFLSNPDLRMSFLKVMTREHPWYTILHVVSLIRDQQLWLQFKNYLLAFGYSRGMIRICRFCSMNQAMVGSAVRLKRAVVRSGFYLWLDRNSRR